MKKYVILLLVILAIGGCTARTETVNRPVETIVIDSGEMHVVAQSDKLYLYVPRASLKGKPIKNQITEADLRECGIDIPRVTKTTLH